MLTLQFLMSRVFLKFIFSLLLSFECSTSASTNLKQIKKISSVFSYIYYKIVTKTSIPYRAKSPQLHRIQWFSGFQLLDNYL